MSELIVSFLWLLLWIVLVWGARYLLTILIDMIPSTILPENVKKILRTIVLIAAIIATLVLVILWISEALGVVSGGIPGPR